MRHRHRDRVAARWRPVALGLLALGFLIAFPSPLPAQREQESQNPDENGDDAARSQREQRRAERRTQRDSDGRGNQPRANRSDRGRQSRESQRQTGGGFVTSDSLQAMADPDMVVLYFDPLTISAVEGGTFSSTLTLSNPTNREFDLLQLAIRYNDAVVEPVGGSPREAVAQAERLDIRQIPEQDLVLAEVAFSQPRTDSRMALFDIIWEARREIDSTEIGFPLPEMLPNFVGMQGGANTLGSPVRGASGLIPAEVHIFPNLTSLEIAVSGEEISLPWEQDGTAQDFRDRGVELALVPEGDVGGAGLFDVDVIIHNPEGAFADDIAFTVRFDPDLLEVIDTHDDNWIENGINIWDGGYHARYPFDLHLENHADNLFGVIRYRMGFSDPQPLASGTVATIRFRAKRGGLPAEIAFDAERTRVRSMGFDVLGDPDIDDDGTHSAVVAVPRLFVGDAEALSSSVP